MAIRNVSIFQVHPGRRQEFLKEAAEAKKILERMGVSWRAAETMIGGPNTGSFVVALEFDDMAAFAAFTQKAQADSEWQAFQARLNGMSSPTRTLVSRSLLTDVTL
jgi:heme-degrading monooxygenase HmoA